MELDALCNLYSVFSFGLSIFASNLYIFNQLKNFPSIILCHIKIWISSFVQIDIRFLLIWVKNERSSIGQWTTHIRILDWFFDKNPQRNRLYTRIGKVFHFGCSTTISRLVAHINVKWDGNISHRIPNSNSFFFLSFFSVYFTSIGSRARRICAPSEAFCAIVNRRTKQFQWLLQFFTKVKCKAYDDMKYNIFDSIQ